jgi:hypothetical protein
MGLLYLFRVVAGIIVVLKTAIHKLSKDVEVTLKSQALEG